MARNKARLTPEIQPPGEQKEGYVLVKAILTRGAPDSVVPGIGRYPRMLYGQHWWIHPGDLAQTSYFELLPDVPVAPPEPEVPSDLFPEDRSSAPAGFIAIDADADAAKTLQAAFAERVTRKKKPDRKDELRELLDKA